MTIKGKMFGAALAMGCFLGATSAAFAAGPGVVEDVTAPFALTAGLFEQVPAYEPMVEPVAARGYCHPRLHPCCRVYRHCGHYRCKVTPCRAAHPHRHCRIKYYCKVYRHCGHGYCKLYRRRHCR